ncbi:Uma2 family endonuclease [Candidatus Poriferisodalis sp.]|uniref:Uma2 family endonuclease n=1 Tax=Candidatus Poriferisodalis sp. TaxID=3101277 RepID=UPI003B020621
MKTATEASSATLLTAEDLLRLDAQGVRGELVRGVFCEMTPAGDTHSKIAFRLGLQVGKFVEEHRLGTAFAADYGIQLERDPDTVRAPDFAFTSYQRRPPGSATEKYGQWVPELVAEVVSPSDRRPDVDAKARMWVSYGVQLVWVVFPRTRTVEVYRAAAEAVETLTEAGSLDGGDVLPGFAYPLSRLFAD